jgi:methyl-accepting chemotaxis protein
MKVWHKILVAPGVAIAFLVLLGAISYAMLARQNESLELIATQRMARFSTAADAAREMGQIHSSVYRMITWISNYDEAKLKIAVQQQKQAIDAVGASMAKLAALPDLAPAERKLVNDVRPQLATYASSVDKAVDLSTVDVATGLMMMQAADIRFQSMIKDFDDLLVVERKLANESYEAAGASFRTTVLALAALVALAALTAFAVALQMSRAIVRPLRTATQTADQIAKGDLSTVVEVKGQDETAHMLRALAEMSESLRELVGEVANGARTVADTSEQIAQGNQDLSQRTEEQASTLEETASSMEELTSTVTQNAQNARDASQLAVGASDVARRGGVVVSQVVDTMTGISASSRKISEITSVIDGIAFQTNILALNAAVEAARAGDQGRGFAVVAAEVRNLAQRSAAAAKEIKSLIVDSTAKVDAGTRMVDEAGKTMEEIVTAVARVSNLVAEIAAASQEQSSGIGQVNTAVTQMDQVVQKNASLVEEATAATESMKEQARSLLQLVSRFKLGHEAAAPLQSLTPQPQPAAVPPIRHAAGQRLQAPPTKQLATKPAARVANGDWQEF